MLFPRHGTLHSLLPRRSTSRGWYRGALGGVVGIAAAGAAGLLVPAIGNTSLPWLVAPVGASAVLIFAVPASPLAQPWPVIGGNVLSTAIGMVAGHLLQVPLLAATLALGTAMFVMSATRCLHPPGGACALLYALGASGPEAWGILPLLTIAFNVVALAGVGWLYNNATGHSWPHRPATDQSRAVDGIRSAQVHAALTAVLAEWDELIDADVHDLDAIFLEVERRIRSREEDATINSG